VLLLLLAPTRNHDMWSCRIVRSPFRLGPPEPSLLLSQSVIRSRQPEPGIPTSAFLSLRSFSSAAIVLLFVFLVATARPTLWVFPFLIFPCPVRCGWASNSFAFPISCLGRDANFGGNCDFPSYPSFFFLPCLFFSRSPTLRWLNSAERFFPPPPTSAPNLEQPSHLRTLFLNLSPPPPSFLLSGVFSATAPPYPLVATVWKTTPATVFLSAFDFSVHPC